jgi:hypothetical protein
MQLLERDGALCAAAVVRRSEEATEHSRANWDKMLSAQKDVVEGES